METWGGMGLEQLCIAETHLWSSHLFPIYAPQLLVHNPRSKPTAFPRSGVLCRSLLVPQHPQDCSNSGSKTARNLDLTNSCNAGSTPGPL